MVKNPFGHFYSPIISKVEIDELKDVIWGQNRSVQGVDLNVNGQRRLLKEFERYYSHNPFDDKRIKMRFYFGNGSFEQSDALLLYFIIKHFTPRKIMEIGSGFSSALMFDIKECCMPDIDLTFIEPFPAVLNSLLKKEDLLKCEILTTKVQNVSVERFTELNENDILFIDSSHVSKTGSDVNFEIFEILPNLNKGVIVHFHDIFYPFEYPEQWVYDGRNWNECYVLRAFLSNNSNYEILAFSDFLHKQQGDVFEKMPLMRVDSGGSLWIRKK